MCQTNVIAEYRMEGKTDEAVARDFETFHNREFSVTPSANVATVVRSSGSPCRSVTVTGEPSPPPQVMLRAQCQLDIPVLLFIFPPTCRILLQPRRRAPT